MKIYKDHIDLTIEEFKELSKKDNRGRKKTKLTKKQIETIKHIFEINPKRSIRSVARELKTSRNKVKSVIDDLHG